MRCAPGIWKQIGSQNGNLNPFSNGSSLVNEEAGNDVVCKRGLRQESLVFHLHFLACADGISNLIKKAVSTSLIHALARSQEIILQCKKSRTNCYLLKLDFKKAHNMVYRECLLEDLRHRGFGNKRVTQMETWLNSVKVQVLINGEAGKDIVCERGLRQGDTPH